MDVFSAQPSAWIGRAQDFSGDRAMQSCDDGDQIPIKVVCPVPEYKP